MNKFTNITEEGLRMLKTIVDPAYKTKPVVRQQRNNGLSEEQRRILQTNRNKHRELYYNTPLPKKYQNQIKKLLENPKRKKNKMRENPKRRKTKKSQVNR